MMSHYEARKLDELERELRHDSPALARRLESFGGRWLLLRLVALTIGTAVTVIFMAAEKGIDAMMFGSGVIALCLWGIRQRAAQLRHRSRGVGSTTASHS